MCASQAQAHFSNKKAIWGPAMTPDGHSAFPVYRDLGVSIVQMQLVWRFVALKRPRHASNPNDPAYHWPADIGNTVRQAKRYHMRVLLMVLGTPAWANGGKAENVAPRQTRDYTDFVTAASRHYRSVHMWMIWGETNRRVVFQQAPASPTARHLNAAQRAAPHRYSVLLDAAYGALKRVSRRNLVIGGNTFTTGEIRTGLWVQNMRLPNGKPPRMDLYGHNPFSFRRPSLSNPPSPQGEVDFSDLGRLSRLVDRNLAARHKHLKLFLSEWTIPTAPGDTEFNFWVEPGVAAQWINSAWGIVHRSSFIYALGWIHLADDATTTGGLLDSQGNPKPTYGAFKAG